jgi:acyl-CoA thioesterase-1
MLKPSLLIASLLFLVGCGEAVTTKSTAQVLVVGDSMLASNRTVGGGVGDTIEEVTGVEVVDRSVIGASYFHSLPISGAAGLRISAQYRPGPWQVVVANGGGNDLLLGCGCGDCGPVLDRLISADGRAGVIPAFVSRLKSNGAHVVYVGYLRNPGRSSPIKACGPAGNELDRRLGKLDALDPNMTFIPMSDLIPFQDLSYHQADRIHPSQKGSREIGLRIAKGIKPLLTLR